MHSRLCDKLIRQDSIQVLHDDHWPSAVNGFPLGFVLQWRMKVVSKWHLKFLVPEVAGDSEKEDKVGTGKLETGK